MPDLDRLSAALRSILPPGAAVAATDPQADHPLLPGEQIAAVPRRLREYGAGRAALRIATAALGLPPLPVPMNADRSPAIRPGLAASITHTATACLAAAMTGIRALGIDLEPDEPLPRDIIAETMTAAEARAQTPRVVFSAKEALYKAQYPLTRALFGYDAVAITLSPGTFTGTFLQGVPGFPAGTRLQGRWVRAEGHVLTAVIL
jgi:4'-phosphopantetheinyl transferase EntD